MTNTKPSLIHNNIDIFLRGGDEWLGAVFPWGGRGSGGRRNVGFDRAETRPATCMYPAGCGDGQDGRVMWWSEGCIANAYTSVMC